MNLTIRECKIMKEATLSLEISAIYYLFLKPKKDLIITIIVFLIPNYLYIVLNVYKIFK